MTTIVESDIALLEQIGGKAVLATAVAAWIATVAKHESLSSTFAAVENSQYAKYKTDTLSHALGGAPAQSAPSLQSSISDPPVDERGRREIETLFADALREAGVSAELVAVTMLVIAPLLCPVMPTVQTKKRGDKGKTGKRDRVANNLTTTGEDKMEQPSNGTNGHATRVNGTQVDLGDDDTAVDEKRLMMDYVGQLAAISKSQAVIEFNLDGTIITANENFTNTVGYSLAEIRGKHHRIFCEESYRNSAEYKKFWRDLANGIYQAGEFCRVGKDGNEIWLQATYNPIMDDEGRPFKVVKYASDITAQKIQNADYAGQLAAISKAQAVIEFNLDGVILNANDNFLKTLGYTLEEVRGKHHRMFVEEEYRSSPEYREFWANLNKGVYSAGEYKRLAKGGREIWIQASYNPILDFNGRPFKVVKYATDITKQTEMRNVLKKTMEGVALNSQSLAAASEELTQTSQSMTATAEETSNQANVVSAAAEQVSKNVQTVATGTEEMSASIREIASNASEAAKIATQAVGVARSTNDVVSKLGTSSTEIGKVVKVINSIAEQTNLLALNATIEAARAGEAGKGFAVVANEVKELAKETARATEEISQKISAIQLDTEGAIKAIAEISGIINKVNDISNTIASAVEEQTATTNEMSRNVAEAARGSNEIADNILSVAKGSSETVQGANNTKIAAEQLAGMACELQRLVDQVGDLR